MKKTAYVAPLILTINVSLAEAQAGSSPPVEVREFSLDSPSWPDEGKDKSWKNKGKNKDKDKDWKDKDNDDD